MVQKMYIWFDDNKNITSVTDKLFNSPNFIYSPYSIQGTLNKTIELSVPKIVSGKNIYVNDKNKETRNRVHKGKFNEPVMENKTFQRSVTLLNAPGEWKLDEVLEAKYKLIAGINGFSSYWYDEFFSDSSIDLFASNVNTSSKGISILPGSSLVLKPIMLSKKVKKGFIYVESEFQNDLDITCKSASGKSSNGPNVSIDSSNSVIIFVKNNSEHSIPVTSIAILY